MFPSSDFPATKFEFDIQEFVEYQKETSVYWILLKRSGRMASGMITLQIKVIRLMIFVKFARPSTLSLRKQAEEEDEEEEKVKE